jgi:hypothetical protein
MPLDFARFLGYTDFLDIGGIAMSTERKIISVSGKRQVTIPQRYYDALGFGNEAECVLREDMIILRPIRDINAGAFSEQILADLVKQGYTGQELLKRFKQASAKVAPAMGRLVEEADGIAQGKAKGASMKDVFGTGKGK